MSDDMVELGDDSQSMTVDDPVEDFSTSTQIQNRYTFWYRTEDSKNVKQINYKDSIKKVASFQTVERFWQIYDHLKRASDFPKAEFHLFKDGIFPMWEDPQNKAGGKWMLRLRKGIGARYWEDILLAIIGEQFDVGSEICGAVLNVRSNEDIISIWNKSADNAEAVSKIREQIRKIVRLPPAIPIEYKCHQDSLVDKFSYRNPSMVWRAPPKSFEKDHRSFHTKDPRHSQSTDYKQGWKSKWGSNPGPPNSVNSSVQDAEREKKDGAYHEHSATHWRNPVDEVEKSGSATETVHKVVETVNSGAPSVDGWTKVRNPFQKK